MNRQEERKKELDQYGFSEDVLVKLYGLVDVKNYKLHTEIRDEFVNEGTTILPIMHKLLHSEDLIIRKSAIKVVESIADNSSIPEMIRMLEDRESEIRWIAGETLINIGRSCIKPLLKALVEGGSSYYLQQGARHVLVELVSQKNDSKELKQLVTLLKSEIILPDKVPVDAAQALKKIY
ncbi:MAG: HEAT repeat domain-containing protein [Bacteroidetes bacterium]|nr:HEAT repeat domain-containing protein [Bacteroidota bacterium]